MARSKRHHYVPQVLSRRFLDVHGKLWYSERIDQAAFSKPAKRTPQGMFWERNYNTTVIDGLPSDQIERDFWAPVDSELGEFLTEIEEIFEAGRTPSLGGASLAGFKELVAAFLKRSIDIGGRYSPTDIGNELRDRILGDARAVSVLDAYSPQEFERFGRHIRAVAIAHRSERILNTLRSYELRWALAGAKDSFVLGSRMVLISGGALNAMSGGSDIIFPLSPKKAAVLTPRFVGVPLRMEYSRGMVKNVNSEMRKQSKALASHSRELLRSVIRGRSS
ncbi:DUF4238 domain-containing protein [Oceanicola sp. 22II-s10i]|uniref:DUF4238 domain-containing protein n=1 Tax=Oceanicola sp. 22II-s10i TaxID=1317116 RepID=UPI000B522C66|nr:DUF4238 domain-containing protein [Oceanicola sp. 22II-s10i]